MIDSGIIFSYFSITMCKTTRCGYSLDAPRRGASNEYPTTCFLIKKYAVDTH